MNTTPRYLHLAFCFSVLTSVALVGWSLSPGRAGETNGNAPAIMQVSDRSSAFGTRRETEQPRRSSRRRERRRPPTTRVLTDRSQQGMQVVTDQDPKQPQQINLTDQAREKSQPSPTASIDLSLPTSSIPHPAPQPLGSSQQQPVKTKTPRSAFPTPSSQPNSTTNSAPSEPDLDRLPLANEPTRQPTNLEGSGLGDAANQTDQESRS